MEEQINSKPRHFLKQKVRSKLAIAILVTLLVITSSYIIFGCKPLCLPPLIIPFPSSVPANLEAVEKFSSEENFKAYLAESESGLEYMTMGAGVRALPEWREAIPGEISIQLESPLSAGESIKAPTVAVPERVSETTVQVLGIDEPDIVKTDGKEIYFSPGQSYYRQIFLEYYPQKITGQTKAIKAFPPADLAIEGEIDKRGDLLLYKNTLVIFSGNEISGYDVSNPKEPEKKWKAELEDKNYLVGVRLYQDKIYLITATRVNAYYPCPIRTLSVGGVSLEIKCIDIYHPVVKVPVDIVYNAMVLDPQTGEVENTVSFVGSSGSSVVYMSASGIYVTYSYYESTIKFFSDFFTEKCQDIIPALVIEKMEKLQGYDISETAKFAEFQIIFEQYYNSLSNDERMRIENEFTNRMTDYYKEHRRELGKTGIVKIGLSGFKVSAVGNVPGKPLNQFSLDEYQNHLRIATTIGDSWGMMDGAGESANDVYVLDKNLKITGSVQDLGLTEKIYSARFIEDKGYLVTFRQIDPFYVIDLSDPKNPELKGELKIPGYSSYLHPITKDKILGMGKEGSNVKVSLFDVTLPEKPIEKDKYLLQEYWSDILNTHHAFLLDTKHEIFFLPGSKGGYVFSYKNDKLGLARTVSGISARRAIYIDDYLYIIGDDQLVVLNELNWEKVNEIEF